MNKVPESNRYWTRSKQFIAAISLLAGAGIGYGFAKTSQSTKPLSAQPALDQAEINQCNKLLADTQGQLQTCQTNLSRAQQVNMQNIVGIAQSNSSCNQVNIEYLEKKVKSCNNVVEKLDVHERARDCQAFSRTAEAYQAILNQPNIPCPQLEAILSLAQAQHGRCMQTLIAYDHLAASTDLKAEEFEDELEFAAEFRNQFGAFNFDTPAVIQCRAQKPDKKGKMLAPLLIETE